MVPICFALATTLMVLMASYRGLHAQMITDAKRLLTNLMQNYDNNFRPVLNQSKPVVVYTGLDLISIQDFNEVDEKISFTAILLLEWYDEQLIWDPKDNGGIKSLNIDVNMIWTPQMMLTNSVGKIDRISEDWHAVSVTDLGRCFYYIGNVFTSSCDVDVTFYPWDKQTCSFEFMPANYDTSKIKLSPSESNVLLNHYSGNGAWDLVSTGVKTQLGDYMVVFEIELERKPRFVIVNVILPLIFMSVLNIMVFLIPTECGERISYCLTVLLSIAVFLTLVGDNLPKNSSPMSLLSYYLVSVLVISVAITLAVICSLHLYHRSGRQPAAAWRAIASCLSCGCARRTASGSSYTAYRSDDDTFERTEQAKYSSSHDMNLMPFPTYTRGVIMDRPLYINRGLSSDRPETTKRPRAKMRDDETSSAFVEITWADVSVALDKVLFVFFVLILITDTLCFMLMIYHNITL
ncbi:hypothetical protein DPMN_082162 [Dreissena polymorpha]|uniref:Uncharacterized protein n=1 Tax=Dreissena polymorpha TaxID=45954 RepID=A0A9D3Y9H4_DREPO|nr:hypothetical protein DPMN_082162 [Dreissena polymorpha]